MTASLLDDAFAHHTWATIRLIDECASLTPEQLETPAPGTYGSIIDMLRHLVRADTWYLTFFRNEPATMDDGAEMTLSELRSRMESNAAAWAEVLAGGLDPDADTIDLEDGWEFHSSVGLRLAQVTHHGTDHRSQICTALTTLGVTPPEIDLWVFGEATRRTRAVRAPTP